MNGLIEETISCPYCGELIDVLIDLQNASQEYIEDCQVCCRPITFVVANNQIGTLSVNVYSENETY